MSAISCCRLAVFVARPRCWSVLFLGLLSELPVCSLRARLVVSLAWIETSGLADETLLSLAAVPRVHLTVLPPSGALCLAVCERPGLPHACRSQSFSATHVRNEPGASASYLHPLACGKPDTIAYLKLNVISTLCTVHSYTTAPETTAAYHRCRPGDPAHHPYQHQHHTSPPDASDKLTSLPHATSPAAEAPAPQANHKPRARPMRCVLVYAVCYLRPSRAPHYRGLLRGTPPDGSRQGTTSCCVYCCWP